MRFKAPENTNSVSVGGETFNVDDTGHIEVPDVGEYRALLIPHGFTEASPAEPKAKTAGKKKAADAGDDQAQTADQATGTEASPAEGDAASTDDTGAQ